MALSIHNLAISNARRAPAAVRARRGARSRRARHGLTLIEVMATVLLTAIVMPAIMEGMSLATAAGGAARHRNEASGLADCKLAELIASGQWQNGGGAGGFDVSFPDYRADYQWNSQVVTWFDTNVSELDVHVTWQERGKDQIYTVSSLVYAGDADSGTGAGGSSASPTGSTP